MSICSHVSCNKFSPSIVLLVGILKYEELRRQVEPDLQYPGGGQPV
jgi:hypothetical protein